MRLDAREERRSVGDAICRPINVVPI